VRVAALGELSLRARVAALLAGLAAVLVVVGLVTSAAVSETRGRDHYLRDRLQPASKGAESLFVAYLDQETGNRGYDLTGDPKFLEPFTKGTADAARLTALLQERLPDAQTRQELASLTTLHQRWLTEAALPQQAAVQAGDLAEAARIVRTGHGKELFDDMRTAVDRLRNDLEGKVKAAGIQADRASRQVFWALDIGAGALLAGIVIAGWLLRRWVLMPTTLMQGQLRRVADGDYGEQIEPTGPPELAAVAAAAELMRERIVTELDRSRQAIEALYQSGPVVTGLREELAATPALRLAGLSLHGVLSAAEGILAGDWYDAIPLADGRTALLIADVSGHGAAAGLVALRVKLCLTSALSLGLSPASALAHATSTFSGEEERFASCVVVVLDPGHESLTWANAGHPSPLLFTPDAGNGPNCEELEPTGPLLSFFDGHWDERTVAFRRGQLLLGYTDGLTEARDEDGRQFETAGVLRALGELPSANPVAAVVACMAAVRSHAVDLRRDDVTVVAVAHED
jgi:serine phosphatase RsbU (regulator of sigma subunit)/CHASE3 domain sensor protein